MSHVEEVVLCSVNRSRHRACAVHNHVLKPEKGWVTEPVDIRSAYHLFDHVPRVVEVGERCQWRYGQDQGQGRDSAHIWASTKKNEAEEEEE